MAFQHVVARFDELAAADLLQTIDKHRDSSLRH
jgi:hypothetical protein